MFCEYYFIIGRRLSLSYVYVLSSQEGLAFEKRQEFGSELDMEYHRASFSFSLFLGFSSVEKKQLWVFVIPFTVRG
jgi:hypothetical protein